MTFHNVQFVQSLDYLNDRGQPSLALRGNVTMDRQLPCPTCPSTLRKRESVLCSKSPLASALQAASSKKLMAKTLWHQP